MLKYYKYLQVSSGTVDQAKKLIDKILRQCNKPLMDDEQVSTVQSTDTYCTVYVKTQFYIKSTFMNL